MSEGDNPGELAERAFTDAGDALTSAVAAVRRLRELGGVQGPAFGYLMHCARRLDEALSNLGLARLCLKAMQASGRDAAQEQQGDLFRPVAGCSVKATG